MAGSLSSLALLALVCGAVIVSSFSVDNDYYSSYMKRRASGAIDARNFPMSFGKRAAPALAGGLDRMAYRMNFGKRSSGPLTVDDDSEEMIEQEKRMDKTAFRVGFGRR